MCYPMAIMAVGMVMSAAGTVMGARAQREEGKAANQAAQYRAKVGRNNAKIARSNADQAFLAGRQRASNKGVKSAASKDKFVAAAAGQGVDVGDSQSIDDVAGDITGIGTLDQLTIAHQGIREAANYNQQAANLEAGAALDIVGGQNAQINANNAAMGSLVGGLGKTVSSVASKWGNFSGGGVPDVSGAPGNTFGGGGGFGMFDDELFVSSHL